MTIDEYKLQNRIENYVESLGAKIVGMGIERRTNVCPAHTHKPGHQCVNINVQKQIWRCNDCQIGGDIIRWMALSSGNQDGEILKSVGVENQRFATYKSEPSHTPQPEPAKNAKIAATYEYHTALGEVAFEVVRLEPKSFRQRHKDSSGNWVWNMDGVNRVLYRLPEVLKSDTVAICEGEKDAQTLVKLGYCGTCNVGGAGKWLDGYTESLAGKNVLIFGDNDKAGKDHAKLVFESTSGKAKTVKIIKLPEQHKDVTDYVEAISDKTKAKAELDSLIANANTFIKGVSMPLFTMAELESRYRQYTMNLATASFNLGQWLPSFNRMRRLVPGELVAIVGGTGTGKTALLQSIALAALPLPTILFELELPSELLFERFISARLSVKATLTASEVEKTYAGGDILGENVLNHEFRNLFICDEANLSIDTIESIISRSELKIGVKPKLVLVDYIQLIGGKGDSRYGRVSDVAESLKRIAKSTGTIIIFSSQRQRPAKDEKGPEVSLYSAKESGSIENSAGLLIGAWRDKEDATLLNLRVLKSTKGGAGMDIKCNFKGETMLINERSMVGDRY